jgi:hypothetical protein
MLIIGWDWASDKHDLVLLNAQGQPDTHWTLAHRGAALTDLAGRLAARGVPPGEVHIGIEDHDGPIIPALQALGYVVHALNPKQVQAARIAFCDSAAKDDLRDAQVMALMLSRDLSRWHRARPLDAPADELRQLCEQHDDLVAQRVRVMDRLRALLMTWLPELHALLPGLDSAFSRELLQHWPLPQQWASVSAPAWRGFFRRHRLPHAKRDALRRLATAPLMPLPPSRQASLAAQLVDLAEQLDLLCRQLDRLGRQLAETWHDYPERELLATLPIGEGVLRYRLAAILGTDRRQPLSWQEHAVHSGVAPVTISSGKHHGVHRRRGCDQREQQALTQFAFHSLRTTTWAKALYDRQRAKGKTHNTALRQVARKWLRVAYSVWYYRTPYDPALPKACAAA